MAKKIITTERDGYSFAWSNGGPGFVDVTVTHLESGMCVMQWCYGCPGLGRSLMARSSFWQEQATMQAKAEHKELLDAKAPDRALCSSRCGNPCAEEEHGCPYRDEIEKDYDFRCNCCSDCE